MSPVHSARPSSYRSTVAMPYGSIDGRAPVLHHVPLLNWWCSSSPAASQPRRGWGPALPITAIKHHARDGDLCVALIAASVVSATPAQREGMCARDRIRVVLQCSEKARWRDTHACKRPWLAVLLGMILAAASPSSCCEQTSTIDYQVDPGPPPTTVADALNSRVAREHFALRQSPAARKSGSCGTCPRATTARASSRCWSPRSVDCGRGRAGAAPLS